MLSIKQNTFTIRLSFLFVLFFHCLLDVRAQTLEHVLEPYYNSSFEPAELNETSASRVRSLFEYYSDKNKIKGSFDRKEYEDFVYRANFSLEQLNKSGEIFYNDSISLYLNDLKDLLLEKNPKKKDIKIYLTRHPSFNAFTNDFGNVYVNVAAVAKLKSESEILALLAHEISHILSKHTHKFEEFKKKVESGTWRTNREKLVLSKHVFSKEQEYEADLEGFKLLANLGVDLNAALKIFDRLRYDLDPNQEGAIDFSILTMDNNKLNNLISSISDNLELVYTDLKEESNDSLTTHPLTTKRKTVISGFIKKEKAQNSYQPSNRFSRISQIANYVLINTYIESGWYIECLDHVIKLRAKSPKDEYLATAQAKVMVLLTQAKYNGSPYDQFINEKGSAYSNSDYLKFKELLLSLNSLDANLASLTVISRLKQKFGTPYLDRLHGFLIQFLYKYNKDLFTNGESGISLITRADSASIKVNSLDLKLNFSTSEIDYYNSLIEDEDLVPVKMRSGYQTLGYLNYYLENYTLSSKDLKSINDYKKLRSRYEKMLTLDQVLVSMNPDEALRYYKRGRYSKSKGFDNLKKTALVQSSSVSLNSRGFYYYMDYKKSLELEAKMLPVLQSFSLVNKNFSNTNYSELTSEAINYHYYLKLWIDERFAYNDLIYSVVDEQIVKFRKEKKIDYLLYNINGEAEKKQIFKKNVTYGYNIFFDLESEGITYISKVATKEKGNEQIFKQLFHLSEFYTKK